MKQYDRLGTLTPPPPIYQLPCTSPNVGMPENLYSKMNGFDVNITSIFDALQQSCLDLNGTPKFRERFCKNGECIWSNFHAAIDIFAVLCTREEYFNDSDNTISISMDGEKYKLPALDYYEERVAVYESEILSGNTRNICLSSIESDNHEELDLAEAELTCLGINLLTRTLELSEFAIDLVPGLCQNMKKTLDLYKDDLFGVNVYKMVFACEQLANTISAHGSGLQSQEYIDRANTISSILYEMIELYRQYAIKFSFASGEFSFLSFGAESD